MSQWPYPLVFKEPYGRRYCAAVGQICLRIL